MICTFQRRILAVVLLFFIVFFAGCGRETEKGSNEPAGVVESGSAMENDTQGYFWPENLPELQSKVTQAPADAAALFWANPPYEIAGDWEYTDGYGTYFLVGIWPRAEYCIYDAEAVIDENGNITEWKKGECAYRFWLNTGEVEVLHLFVPEILPNQLLQIESDYGSLQWPIYNIEGEHSGAFAYINSDGTIIRDIEVQ